MQMIGGCQNGRKLCLVAEWPTIPILKVSQNQGNIRQHYSMNRRDIVVEIIRSAWLCDHAWLPVVSCREAQLNV